eukprot:TRINITY_DN4403_c2_g1_i1.p1 TRINITY_DN4403_c2_g1~~TRINITY_DN4403_c2_g1_i1.p1  ORF type:complete len:145 (+),score=49.56 TRINITY_DN4403_c2_g1_i1:31-435(+)
MATAATASATSNKIKRLGSNVSKQRRLAASVLRTTRERVWIDPTRLAEVAADTGRQAIRQSIAIGLIKDRSTQQRPMPAHERLARNKRLRAVREATVLYRTQQLLQQQQQSPESTPSPVDWQRMRSSEKEAELV